ncbi:MAG: response regulator [Lachnospiraceae bacterium]|nr:response regulator [Lachnospiraceae bacterium]
MRNRERLVLTVYSIYVIAILFLMSHEQIPKMTFALIGIALASAWVQFFVRFRTYSFRVYFLTILLQVAAGVYSAFLGSLSQALPTYMAILVLLALYEMRGPILLAFISITGMAVFHVCGLHTIEINSVGDFIRVFFGLVPVYCTQYALDYLVKRQKGNQVRLQQTIEDLKNMEKSKDDFLANVSHEIRTPINTICGISEIILRERLEDGMQENVYSIQNAGRNLLSVVSDILDFSELQSGNVAVVEEEYNISSTLNDIISISMAKLYEKPVELLVDCDATLPAGLIGDEQKIRRVMMNLVGNAIKFTNEGYVSIRVGYRKESYGMNLIVSIKDTGIGMTQESLEKLFTSFNQVDTSRNRRGEGIGLGLAISQAIIQKMGGFLTVRSEYGKGSEVQFVIPQKVVNETPIVSVYNAKEMNIAVYLDREHFTLPALRNEYRTQIVHMAEQLGIKCYACQDLAELKRCSEREKLTHIFLGLSEYWNAVDYFDEMAFSTNVVVAVDHMQEKRLTNPQIKRLFKPFFLLNVVSVLNEEKLAHSTTEAYHLHQERFIAPDAHILVVDDNVMNTRVLEGLLKPYQVRVTAAISGRQALEKIESMNYDFVFMDHMMPEMDGIETLQHIREKQGSYYKEVPIIALTANAIAGVREMFLTNGFQDYVSKPVELSVLERVLKRHIPRNKIIKVSEQKNVEKAQQENGNEFFAEDFDVKKGISYCGSLENYIEALRMYYTNSAQTREQLQQLFMAADWKNYTIQVHALKSGMASIGVARLSEMAKALEQAGKNGDEEYLQKHHGAMLEEYDRIFAILQEHELIGGQQAETAEEATVEAEPQEAGEELSASDFARLTTEFENAAYSFDVTEMYAVLAELQKYSYRGNALREALAPLHKKIEMSDYMSALSVLTGIKEKFER